MHPTIHANIRWWHKSKNTQPDLSPSNSALWRPGLRVCMEWSTVWRNTICGTIQYVAQSIVSCDCIIFFSLCVLSSFQKPKTWSYQRMSLPSNALTTHACTIKSNYGLFLTARNKHSQRKQSKKRSKSKRRKRKNRKLRLGLFSSVCRVNTCGFSTVIEN